MHPLVFGVSNSRLTTFLCTHMFVYMSNEEIPATVGGRVAYLRKLVVTDGEELSARALARIAKLSSLSHVTNVEKGHVKDPAGSTVAKLAAAFGVSADWLLTGAGEAPKPWVVQAHVEHALREQATPSEDEAPVTARAS